MVKTQLWFPKKPLGNTAGQNIFSPKSKLEISPREKAMIRKAWRSSEVRQSGCWASLLSQVHPHYDIKPAGSAQAAGLQSCDSYKHCPVNYPCTGISRKSSVNWQALTGRGIFLHNYSVLFPRVLMFIEAWLTLHRTWDHRALGATCCSWRMHAFSGQPHVHLTQRGQSRLVLRARARSLGLAHVAWSSLIARPMPGASLFLNGLDLMDCDYCPELYFWGVVTHSFVRFRDPPRK